MTSTKIFYLFLPILLLATNLGHAQIITSKKEAVKKGVYTTPAATEKKTVAATKATPEKGVAKTDKKNVSKSAKSGTNKKSLINDEEDKDFTPQPTENYLAMQLINNAMEFIGVHYRGGGTSTSGMDCSGMVTATFNIFGIKLPRSSFEQAQYGEKLDHSEIKKGDLVFFKTNGSKRINHVGMVTEVNGEEIKFIHSSTSKGVMVSSTNEPYYKRTFAQANRVIDPVF